MSFRLAPKRVIAEQQADRGRTPVSFRPAPKPRRTSTDSITSRTPVSFRPAPKPDDHRQNAEGVGDLCHFDWLRNRRPRFRPIAWAFSFRNRPKKGFALHRPRASLVLHGLHALEFRRPPPYISPILALESESTVAQWGLFRMRRCIDSGTRQYGAPA